MASAQTPTIQGFDGSYSKPVISNGVVFISSPTRLYTLNATDGAKLWSTNGDSGANIISNPLVINGTCYIVTANNKMSCIDIITGLPKTIRPFDETSIVVNGITLDLATKITNTATTINGVTYAVSNEGVVSASNGNQIWQQSIANTIYGIQTPQPSSQPNQIQSTNQPITTPEPTATIAPTATPTNIEAYGSANNPSAVYGNFAFAGENTTTVLVAILTMAVIALLSIITVKRKLKKPTQPN